MVTCTDTSYIPDISVNIFRVTHALAKGFNLKLERESLILKKNSTILKSEERLDHGNGDDCLLAMRIYTSPDDTGKTDTEPRNT